jgi:hypothetical protein
MSGFGKKGVRCDWCGRFSNNPNGEYTRPDGSAGYIVQPEWERFPGGDPTVASTPSTPSNNDICEECSAGSCPTCGSYMIVRVTPAVPGPDGWGGRCKTCGHSWTMAAAR